MKNILSLGVAVSTALLAGCSFSGLDARSNFACKAPDGVLCESMSGIYANASLNNLPSQRIKHAHANQSANAVDVTPQNATRVQGEPGSLFTTPLYSGIPLYRDTSKLRVWIAPWEGADKTLYDQSYMYLVLNDGDWLIQHNNSIIQSAYAPVSPPVRSASSTKRADTNQSSTSGSLDAVQSTANTVQRFVSNPENNQQIMQGIKTPDASQ